MHDYIGNVECQPVFVECHLGEFEQIETLEAYVLVVEASDE